MSLKFGQIRPLVSMVADRVMIEKTVSPLFIPPVYEVYRGYIVFAFSVCLLVCVNFFFRQRFLSNYLT